MLRFGHTGADSHHSNLARDSHAAPIPPQIFHHADTNQPGTCLSDRYFKTKQNVTMLAKPRTNRDLVHGWREHNTVENSRQVLKSHKRIRATSGQRPRNGEQGLEEPRARPWSWQRGSQQRTGPGEPGPPAEGQVNTRGPLHSRRRSAFGRTGSVTPAAAQLRLREVTVSERGQCRKHADCVRS